MVIINSPDSNSGMNLLRASVRPYMAADESTYFGSTRVSGGHIDSLHAVAEGRADITTIDCVTYALVQRAFPTLTAAVRVLGFTVQTTSLPFVSTNAGTGDLKADTVTHWFNEALEALPQQHRAVLSISRFRGGIHVRLSTYRYNGKKRPS